MLLAGTNITAAADKLQKINVDYLYHCLRNPKPAIANMIRQLRIVRGIDRKQYSVLKRQLPYTVCGMFNPPFRRTENFAYIECFMLDIDKLLDKNLTSQEVKKRISSDAQVLLAFTSPGEDGLKILFRLTERCFDSGIYSLFYKAFARDFSMRYGLEQVIDTQTCDVCRACFISMDPEAYYNPQADAVDMQKYINLSNPDALFGLNKKLVTEAASSPKPELERSKEPEKDVMDKIRKTLNPKANIPDKPPVYVPQQLDDILGGLQAYVAEKGIELYEVINIQYGKKLRFRLGRSLSEINLFFGKKGFSVVQSPRTGTSAEMNQLMADVINSFLVESAQW